MTLHGSAGTKIAVLGVSHWHLPLYLPGFSEADVVGVWDRVPARAERLAGAIGTTAYGSRASLLDQGIDLAFVFGDPWEMLDYSRECLGRGIPISVEKPAAPSLHELEELVAEVDRSGVNAFTPLVFRFSGIPAAIKNLGPVGDLHAQYLTGPSSRYVAGGFDWAVKESVLGAGCLGNLGPHFVDLFSLAVGTTGLATKYVEARRPGPGEADDRALVVLGSGEGRTATIDVGYTTPHAQLSVGPSVVVTGSHGTLVVTDKSATLMHVDGSTSDPCPPLQWQTLFLDYVRAVVANPVGGSELPDVADLRNAYRTLSRPPEAGVPSRSSTVTA
ncbi:Gfo/Idh/MocA family protein [Pedococcus sp. 5OH_020]|uniref:Gfo/Idh/MocA family protein n=1 Tax=Pedococcus sp. 5OH_020 TaxID=2989814 RepID=UPI0022E99C83|nr:Gfo/Idh/MocA family oxidoreductase [Pedococcus sp. 5OH_020]